MPFETNQNLFDIEPIPELKPPISAWSFSAILEFERCPHSLFLRKIQNLTAPTSPALTKGIQVHTAAEQFVASNQNYPIPPALKKFESEFVALRDTYATKLTINNMPISIEDEWAYTKDWVPTGWLADDCWLRAKLDLFMPIDSHTALVIDYKTGKSRDKGIRYTWQAQLYAVASFMRYPNLEVVQTEFWFLDEGGRFKNSFNRTALPPLLASWNNRGSKLTNAVMFPPKPNRMNCRFCDWGAAGTNQCSYAMKP